MRIFSLSCDFIVERAIFLRLNEEPLFKIVIIVLYDTDPPVSHNSGPWCTFLRTFSVHCNTYILASVLIYFLSFSSGLCRGGGKGAWLADLLLYLSTFCDTTTIKTFKVLCHFRDSARLTATSLATFINDLVILQMLKYYLYFLFLLQVNFSL